jgi:transposase-like protein
MSEEPARVEGGSPARAGEAARQLIRRTRQVPRRKFPAEEKIRIVLEGIRGEVAVSELCRREGIHPTIYYKWLKDFMEAGKGRLRGDADNPCQAVLSRVVWAGRINSDREAEAGLEFVDPLPAM